MKKPLPCGIAAHKARTKERQEGIAMLSLEQIRHAVAPLAEHYGLDRVFLFGSYARGEATEESDVDLRIDRGSMRGLQFGGLYEDIKESLARPVWIY